MNTNQASISQSNTKALYRIMWRWHFYAGIFCIPFVIILALTGATYLFKPYYEHWQERDYRGLVIEDERQLPNDQIAAALAAVEGGKFLSYRLPQTADEAVMINVQADNTWQIYINPYTLEVLGKIRKDQMLMEWVKTLHGELLIGNIGSVLVELAACWAILLVITGLYMWWPRNAQGLAGVLYPRLRQGNRTFWRDLHAVTGIWISALALFLLISGLPWALVWGAALKEVRTFNQAPVIQDWTQNRHQEHMSFRAQANNAFDLSPNLLAKAETLQLAPPLELSVANAMSGSWKLSSQAQNRPLRADVWFSADGTIEKRSNFADRKMLDRVVGFGIAAHEGALFGWINLLLGVATCAGLMLISISGFILWRKRKPEKILGAPPAIPNQAISRIVAGIVLVVAILLPVLAISLILILVLEFVLFRRIAALRTWLGIADA